MEIYILDGMLRPIDVVDVFISMVWTERFAEIGDFELIVIADQTNKRRFVDNTLISITESMGVMRVEIIEEKADADGRQILRIRGRDLLSLLEGRVAIERYGMPTPGTQPSWVIPGISPVYAIQYMFERVCVYGDLSADDIIPFVQNGQSLYPPSTIPEPSDADFEFKPGPLFRAMKEIADIYDLGIRFYKDPDASKLYFNVYTGNDRTTTQTVNTPVVFSPDMQNLTDTTEFTDRSKHFNVVHVLYIRKNEFDNEVVDEVVVTDDEIAVQNTGLDRRAKVLVVTSISEDIPDIPAYLYQLGMEEIRKSRPFGAFDGEVTQHSNYVYGRDYYMGDIVEVRSSTGSSAHMRVVEQIFVQDESGQRSYPTLITKQFINQGTWLSWKYNVEWSAMGSEEYWSTQ